MSLEICRLCLSTQNLSPIFVDITKSKRYTTVLSLTTGLKIEPNDGLPQQICTECTSLVNNALKLRNLSHLTENKLLQYGFKKDKITDNKNNEINENIPMNEQNDGNNGENIEAFDHLSNDSINESLDGLTVLNTDDGTGNQICHKESKVCTKKNCKKYKNTSHNKESRSKREKKALYMSLVDGPLDPDGPVRCNICKKSVSKWSCFISHAKLHLGFKFMCEYCGKSFISSTQLKRHCRSHHGMKRELACKHCNYLALDNAQLVLHERRVHTGERPYVCDVCAASYFSRRCLVQHIESHRTTASVQCDRCPSLLKSRRHLARHRYSAHPRRRHARHANENTINGTINNNISLEM